MPTWNDVTWADGQENMGGTSQVEILYAVAEDIVTWPDYVAVPATDADYNTVTDSFVMVATKKFHKLYLTPETGEVKSSLIGGVDSRSFKHEFEGFHPGGSDAVEALLTKFKNSRGAFVIQESDGTIRLVGTKKFPARLEAVDSTSGKKYDDSRGKTIKIFSYGKSPAPKFTGVAPIV
jgi:hypothetical protein